MIRKGKRPLYPSFIPNEDGSFTLGAGADVLNTGGINVSSQANNIETKAGQVALLGENVTSSGKINADARFGKGGEIEIHAVNTSLLTGSKRHSGHPLGKLSPIRQIVNRKHKNILP